MRNDGSKALSCQAYHEATEAVRMSVFVQPGESKRTDYDSRSTWDRLLDAGSTPARSMIKGIAKNRRFPFLLALSDILFLLNYICLFDYLFISS